MSNAVLIIPALNPGANLVKLIKEAIEYFDDIIIVNDGSKKECQTYFEKCKKIAYDKVRVITHGKNRGKGRALKSAIVNYVSSELPSKYLGVITADCDGQHEIDDIIKLDKLMEMNKSNSIGLGCRDIKSKEMPFRSKLGNNFTAVLFRFLYGIKITDTQTGLRSFTNDILKWLINLKGEKFDYEMNMLTSLNKQNVKVYECNIKTKYEKKHKSHYKTFIDSLRVGKVLLSGMIKYLLAAIVSGVVDLGIFYLIDYQLFAVSSLPGSIFIATVVSRLASSIVNFLFNKFITFGAKHVNKNSLVKYYLLWGVQMLSSFGLVTLFASVFSGGTLIVKLIVDLFLSIISYQIQLHFVFSKKKEQVVKIDYGKAVKKQSLQEETGKEPKKEYKDNTVKNRRSYEGNGNK